MADETTMALNASYLVSALGGARRRSRQEAAHLIAQLAHENPQELVPFTDDLIDALYRPEAHTRWEVLDALGELVLLDADAVADGYDGAEASLFDEGSATVCLAAFRFLCRLGASSPERSDTVWHLLDEAIQCYHGNPEYRDMLIALLEYARGNLSDNAREALVARVGFDAANSQGFTKRFSAQIIAAAKGE